jgi:CRISPR-associated protein Cas1
MKTRTQKIFLNDSGSFLGRRQGCLIVRDKNRKVTKFPLFSNEISEVQIKSGNYVSSGALCTCAFWGIDVVLLTARGHPIAILKNLDDCSHVETRIAQYEALKNGKGIEVAKTLVLGKIAGQNFVLRKYGLKEGNFMLTRERVASVKSDNLKAMKNRLITIEGHATEKYFQQIFKLLPIRIEKRRTFKAYDGINNNFNIAYTLLKWKVYRAIIRAKLEPFLGFLHSEQFGKPSLVCDLMEPYRYLIDDFLIQYCKSLRKKDFAMKREHYSSKRRGEREYLKKPLTDEMMRKLNAFFETTLDIPRVKHGKKQTIETLINEDTLLLAQYLRNERPSWAPRI